jgi:hypothetical protein
LCLFLFFCVLLSVAASLSAEMNNLVDKFLTQGTGDRDGPPLKRARPAEEVRKVRIIDALYGSLWEIGEYVRKNPSVNKERLEVEVRVGMMHYDGCRYVGRAGRPVDHVDVYPLGAPGRPEFIAGVDDSLLGRVRGLLTKKGFTGHNKPVQKLRMDRDGRFRCDVTKPGAQFQMAESKHKFLRNDLSCLSSHYDFRVDAAIEEPVPAGAAVDVVPEWHIERHKSRTTFTCPQMPSWQVDITEVDTYKRGVPGFTSDVELELEMVHSEMISWLSIADDSAFQSATGRTVDQLFAILRACIPMSGHEAGNDRLRAMSGGSALSSVNRLSSVCTAGLGASSQSLFLGAQPVNLNRRSLNAIGSADYFVTEKSDGVRYLLYVVMEAGEPLAVLVDRSMVMFRMPGANVIGRCLGVGTVLDGELVWNLSFKKHVFLVFDVLAVDGRSKCAMPFRERIALVRSEIMRRCAAYLDSAPVPGAEEPTYLIRKDFLPKSEIRSLLSKVTVDDGSRVFWDKDSGGRRHHRSDGIIFQPADLPYQFGTDPNLLKWKWPELISVDLNVEVNRDAERSLRLLAAGPDGTYIDCVRTGSGGNGLGRFDKMRLLGDMSQLENNRMCVAEFAYDPSYGAWLFMHVRKDKARANFISTVLGVLMEQVESISVEELQYRLLASDGSDSDFQEKLNEKKAELLATMK